MISFGLAPWFFIFEFREAQLLVTWSIYEPLIVFICLTESDDKSTLPVVGHGLISVLHIPHWINISPEGWWFSLELIHDNIVPTSTWPCCSTILIHICVVYQRYFTCTYQRWKPRQYHACKAIAVNSYVDSEHLNLGREFAARQPWYVIHSLSTIQHMKCQ